MANWITDLFWKVTTGGTATQAEERGEELDSIIEEQNRIRRERGEEYERQAKEAADNKEPIPDRPAGAWTVDEYDRAEANRIYNATEDADKATWGAAAEGAAAGLDKAKSAANSILSGTLKIVPWPVWAAVGIYLALQTGILFKLSKK